MTRPRYRLCLIIAFSLFTGVGLLVAVVRLWTELVPLRAEVELLRKQMGQLSIENPDLPHAIKVATVQADIWKWRVYLPPLPLAKYVISCTPGLHPPLAEDNVDLMLEDLRRMRSHWAIPSTDYLDLEGEVTIEARIVDHEGYQYLEVLPVGGQVIGVTQDWRSFEDKTARLTGLNEASETVYGRGEPILLLCLQSKPRLVADQYGRGDPQLLSKSVLLWIHSVQ